VHREDHQQQVWHQTYNKLIERRNCEWPYCTAADGARTLPGLECPEYITLLTIPTDNTTPDPGPHLVHGVDNVCQLLLFANGTGQHTPCLNELSTQAGVASQLQASLSQGRSQLLLAALSGRQSGCLLPWCFWSCCTCCSCGYLLPLGLNSAVF